MPIQLIAPPHTPLHEDGQLNLSLVEPQAAHFRRSGVSGVFICGSTGEGMSLSVGERKEMVETWAEIAPLHELEVIVQVGANSQRDAIDLAAHAASQGVRAISAHAPCYFRPQTVNDLIDFFAPVAAAAGDTPFYFYDIPPLTNVSLPTAEFLRLGKDRIPNLAGVKFTNSDLAQFQECLRLDEGRFDIFFGCDEAMLAGYALGAKGAVGSTYNFIAPLTHRIAAAFDAGDMSQAREFQAKVMQTVNILAEYGYGAAAKSVMEFHGLDCGPVRAPLRALSRDQKSEILSRLTAIGFPFETPTESASESNGLISTSAKPTQDSSRT